MVGFRNFERFVPLIPMKYAKFQTNLIYENYDIARAMSSSRADPVLGHCPNWGTLIENRAAADAFTAKPHSRGA